MHNKLKVWETDNYYRKARAASSETSHPGLQILQAYAANAPKILEVGCGEGTKLNSLKHANAELFGIDLSQTAIKIAKKQFPLVNFQVSQAEQLPFKDSSFDMVYSAFVLEHTQNTEQVLQEMIRVVKPGGFIINIAPNYGAPFRKSPCFKGQRVKRIIAGILNDTLFYLGLKNSKLLHWRKVIPIATAEDYQIDWDTTTEPYLAALSNFFQRDDIAIISKTSHWEIPEPGQHKLNSIFRFLGKRHIFPFNYWGPHFTLVVQKRKDSPGKYSNLLRTLANWLKLSIVVIIIILPFTPILLAGFIATTNFLSKKVKLR